MHTTHGTWNRVKNHNIKPMWVNNALAYYNNNTDATAVRRYNKIPIMIHLCTMTQSNGKCVWSAGRCT